jgi:hypothetical protein
MPVKRIDPTVLLGKGTVESLNSAEEELHDISPDIRRFPRMRAAGPGEQNPLFPVQTIGETNELERCPRDRGNDAATVMPATPCRASTDTTPEQNG